MSKPLLILLELLAVALMISRTVAVETSIYEWEEHQDQLTYVGSCYNTNYYYYHSF